MILIKIDMSRTYINSPPEVLRAKARVKSVEHTQQDLNDP